jgi:hypothetical protein
VDPELRLEQTPHGLQVYYRGRRLYGPRPEVDAGRRAGARDIPPQTLVLWPSPLLWHGWREIETRLTGSSEVFAVEADPFLFELARRSRPEAMDDRFHLLPQDASRLLGTLHDRGEHRFRRVVQITTAGSALDHRAVYRRLHELADREIRVFWQNRLTLSAMGRLWTRNIIENVPELLYGEPATLMEGPAVVCGAGPSLERGLPAVTRYRERFALIAVDTALPILSAAGITPDVVVALEGQLANAYDFLPVAAKEYLLVADLSSDPTTARLHRRRTWTITSFAPFTLIDRVAALPGVAATMPPLGSVGVAAVRYALDRGVSPLVCTGLDFAVQPGKTHARGAPSYLTAFARSDRLRPVRDAALGARLVSLPGASGHVSTTLVLRGYADELASITAGRDDLFAVEPIGLSFGAKPIAAEALGSVLDRTGQRVSAPATRQRSPEERQRSVLVDFVRGEMDRLRSADFREPGASLPDELDYLATEIPDCIRGLGGGLVLGPLDASSRARLRGIVDYYLERWKNSLDRLADPG